MSKQTTEIAQVHKSGCKPGGACSWGCDNWEYAPTWGPMEWTPGVDPLTDPPASETPEEA